MCVCHFKSSLNCVYTSACRQFPIGILYDLTTASAPQPSSPSSQDVTSGGSSVTARALPWRLTLHYSPPPHPHEEIMLNTQGAIATAAASVLFLNSLKVQAFGCGICVPDWAFAELTELVHVFSSN